MSGSTFSFRDVFVLSGNYLEDLQLFLLFMDRIDAIIF